MARFALFFLCFGFLFGVWNCGFLAISWQGGFHPKGKIPLLRVKKPPIWPRKRKKKRGNNEEKLVQERMTGPPEGQHFEIHRSKFKPHPGGDPGQTSAQWSPCAEHRYPGRAHSCAAAPPDPDTPARCGWSGRAGLLRWRRRPPGRGSSGSSSGR